MDIAVDFDGVINHYRGWEGKRNFREPVAGTEGALIELKKQGHTIIVNTNRIEVDIIRDYMRRYQIPFSHINFNPKNIEQDLHPAKIYADVYIDDRALRFNGSWSQTLIDLQNLEEPWWRK